MGPGPQVEPMVADEVVRNLVSYLQFRSRKEWVHPVRVSYKKGSST
jgi:hypothetical protein